MGRARFRFPLAVAEAPASKNVTPSSASMSFPDRYRTPHLLHRLAFPRGDERHKGVRTALHALHERPAACERASGAKWMA